MTLDSRYRDIQARVAKMSDFSEQSLAPSRQLFDFVPSPQAPNQRCAIPRRFEVWTNLVGLPLPSDLTQAFQEIWHSVTKGLSPHHRVYAVQPHTYHWEVFIVKRPDETVTPQQLQDSGDRIQHILASQPPFPLTYRGFLITPDGTVLVKGYGEFDDLRHRLRSAVPWASAQQSQLGHISLGRLLDPVGPTYFATLNQQIQEAWDQEYGTLTVDTVKWVHESQWYMEDHTVLKTFSLQ